MKPRNVKCAGADGICTICAIGEELQDDEPCRYDSLRDDNGCPGFECAEQCRLCPEDCEFYGDNRMQKVIEQLEKALELACRYIAEDIYCPYNHLIQQNCTKNCEIEGGSKCWKEFFLKRAVNSDEKMG